MTDSSDHSELSAFVQALRAQLADLPNEALGPEQLADLVNIAAGDTPRAAAMRHELKRDLFCRTVKHALCTTEYYSDQVEYGRALSNLTRSSDFDVSALPLLQRDILAKATQSLLARDSQTAWVSRTAGTVGVPLQIHHSLGEAEFHQRFYRERALATRPRAAPLPLILSFSHIYQGNLANSPEFGKIFGAGVADDMLLKDALRLLCSEFDFPGHDRRISVISGPSQQVAFFTHYLCERGIGPQEFGVNRIHVTGAFLPHALRRFLERAWGARVFDKFSIAEVFGGASRASSDASFKLDPCLFGEVIDPYTGRPLSEGIGELVLTGLYPFVQRQPIIRYQTGDLVRVRKSSPVGLQEFDFLGKVKNCISALIDGSRRWLLHSADLYQALGKFADVRQYDCYSDVQDICDHSVGAAPIFRVDHSTSESGQHALRVQIELRYAPHCHPGRVRALEAEILDELRRNNSNLDRFSQLGRVSFELCFRSPGSLLLRAETPHVSKA